MSEALPCLRNLSGAGIWHISKTLPPLSTVSESERQHDPWNSSPFSRPPSSPQAMEANQLQLQFDTSSDTSPQPRLHYNTEARMHSTHFPAEHQLNAQFVATYQLEDELGSGGYGFVMTAYHRIEGHEVAVKFIIKEKVPDHAWTEDEVAGRLPTEVVLLSYVNHENIVKCLDLFEDSLYFYMVCFVSSQLLQLLMYSIGPGIAWVAVEHSTQIEQYTTALPESLCFINVHAGIVTVVVGNITTGV